MVQCSLNRARGLPPATSGTASLDHRTRSAGCALNADRNGRRARNGIIEKSEHGPVAVEEPCRRRAIQIKGA